MALSILAIPGSLRQGSFNRQLCDAAADHAPDEVAVTVADLRGLPLFDADVEAKDHGGAEVAGLRAQVEAADALLICTPEYNQSIPGGLKNAIDWLSRRHPESALWGKPVAVAGATPGPWGTRYAQRDLRHVLTACGCYVLGHPMLYVDRASTRFGDDGLHDEEVRAKVAALVTALAGWTRTVSA